MKPETLKEIKIQIRKFLPLIESISQHWDSGQSHYTTLAVLVQNISHDSSNTLGYSHEEEVKRVNKICDILRLAANYYNSHFEKMISQEVNCIIDGLSMSESLE